MTIVVCKTVTYTVAVEADSDEEAISKAENITDIARWDGGDDADYWVDYD